MSKYHDGQRPYYNSPVCGAPTVDTKESLIEELKGWEHDVKHGFNECTRSQAQTMVLSIKRILARDF